MPKTKTNTAASSVSRPARPIENTPAIEQLRYAILMEDNATLTNVLKHADRDEIMRRAQDGTDMLYNAVSVGNMFAVRALIRYGFDVYNVQTKFGATALHIAALWGQADVARYLVTELNINPNVQDDTGDTPLIYALLGMGGQNADGDGVTVPECLTTAQLLIAWGARFSRRMYSLFNEMRFLQRALIDDMYRICAARDSVARPRMKRAVKFMIDAMNEHNSLFFDDVALDMIENERPTPAPRPTVKPADKKKTASAPKKTTKKSAAKKPAPKPAKKATKKTTSKKK